jgi:hypothetical protein
MSGISTAPATLPGAEWYQVSDRPRNLDRYVVGLSISGANLAAQLMRQQSLQEGGDRSRQLEGLLGGTRGLIEASPDVLGVSRRLREAREVSCRFGSTARSCRRKAPLSLPSACL